MLFFSRLIESIGKGKIFACIFIVLALFCDFGVLAQQYNFDAFTVKNGLIQSNVTSIIQDNDGFLWFGTEGGISKFNGRVFSGFSTSNGLAESAVQGFTKDKKGRIWVAHTLGKVSVFEKNTFREVNFSKTLGQSRIQSIFTDLRGFIWLCTVERGAICFNPDNPTQADAFGLKEGLDDDVYSGMQSKSGLIWFVTSIGIKTFNPKTSDFDFFKPKDLPFYRYTCIAEDFEGSVWIGTYNHGIIKYRQSDNVWNFYDRSEGLPSSFVTCIVSRKDSSVVCGTWKTDEVDGGIAIFKKDRITGINRQKGLPGEKIYSLYDDIEGNLWIGLKNRGVAEFSGTYFSHLGKREGISNEIINTIRVDNYGQGWVGTDAGISIIQNTGSSTKVRNIETVELLMSNQITDIEDLGATMAVSSFIGDIGLFDKATGQLKERLEINKNYVNCLEVDKNQQLWIGSVNGLTIYDIRTKKFSQVDHLEGKNVMTIKFENNGKIWVGTREGGLYSGSNANTIKKVNAFPHRSPSTICITKKQEIWVGTEGGGLYKILTNGKVAPETEFNRKAEFISGIIEGRDGIIVGTSIGFFILNGKNIRYYDENDGFIHPEVMLNSLYTDDSGSYWFGTNNGITVFKPSEDKISEKGPKVFLESIQVFSKLIPKSEKIKLSYRENDLTFSYTALTYKARGKIRYRYFLEGIDNSYQKETTQNIAHYTNLNPGQYTFKVYAKNSDGLWSSEPAEFRFEITPPFWKTAWFITILIITIIGGVWLYVFFRTLNLRNARQELARQVKERTKEIESKNLNLLEANAIITNKNKEITDSINYAKRIQESILPNPSDLQNFFPGSFIIYKPKDIVSGDFYWFKEEDNANGTRGRIFVAVADCTGHGVPGAFMCMIGSSLLHQILQENPGIKPSGMLQLLDKGINFLLKQNETETKDGMDIALCVYDPNSGTLEFSGAMRPMFLIRKEEQEGLLFHEFKADKESIGGHVANDSKNFENHVIRLEKGDTIYFATDGFTDQFGGVRGKKLMTKKFKDLLQATISDSMTDQEKKILRFWDEWSNGYEQVDDVLVLGLRIDEPYGS